MFNRKVFKSRAKEVLKTTYWSTLGIIILYMLISGVASGIYSLRLQRLVINTGDTAQLLALSGVLIVSNLLFIAISIFILEPISIGLYKFMIDSARSNKTDIGALGYCFRSNYKNIVAVLLMKNLVILAYVLVPIIIAATVVIGLFLSGILSGDISTLAMVLSFVASAALVPAIIKSYDYLLVPYILADNADASWRDSLSKSKQMMRGNRWAAFVMQLSFIGWMLLGMLACSIGIIFVAPYVNAAEAQMYLELSGQSKIEVFDENI